MNEWVRIYYYFKLNTNATTPIEIIQSFVLKHINKPVNNSIYVEYYLRQIAKDTEKYMKDWNNV